MKLLFVATGPGAGGTETHFATLAHALADSGDDVAAVVKRGSATASWLAGGRVRVLYGVFRNAADPRGVLAVARAIAAFQPDWIVGALSKEYWPLLVVGRLAGVPVALFKHVDFPMRPMTKRFVPRLARPFIVVSEGMRRSFVARGIPPGLIQMLANPIDAGRFHPAPELRADARRTLGFGDGEVVVGYLGRLSPEKGVYALADALERAMPRAPALRALWVGNGPDEAALRARLSASAHASRHVLRPFTGELLPIYAALDAVAVPSIIPESFGRVAAEAEACGVPVLASRIGGIPEAVEEGTTGLLLPPRDVEAWSDALVTICADPDLRRRMGEAGPGLVCARFAAPVVAERFRQLLARCGVPTRPRPIPSPAPGAPGVEPAPSAATRGRRREAAYTRT